MLDDTHDRFTKAVQNLVFNCGNCTPNGTLLIIFETGGDGYYDPELAGSVARVASELGLKTEMVGVPFQQNVSDPDAQLAARMAAADCTVFFARLGDQVRFRTKDASMTQVISYALDREMLSSPFGTVPHSAFERLKNLINNAIASAAEIHVTCPDGTDFSGRLTPDLTVDGDVTRSRFPVSVFTPVAARSFKGRLAQRGFLTGTGSNYYEPYSCQLYDTLFVDFDGNRITGFDGSAKDVAAAKAHYESVGTRFGIDTYFVHSWHIGIHPGCTYTQPAAQNFARWSGGAFGNPRLLHFHTCGAYPPGEISLNILDPTVRLDGVALWQDGRLCPDLIPGGTALLDSEPEMRSLFDAPSTAVGQGPDNKLCFA